MRKSAYNGFTLIELMVSMFLTLITVGTFFKLYDNSVKAEKRTSSKTAITVTGERIIDTIAEPVKFVGLSNVFETNAGGDWAADGLIVNAEGASSAGNVVFGFRSPHGGFISKMMNTSTGDAAVDCKFVISHSSSLSNESNQKVNLFSSNGIYSATVKNIEWSQSRISVENIEDSEGDSISSGSCGSYFPMGSLVTGPNYYYKLSYSTTNDGSVTLLRYKSTSDLSPQTILNFQSKDTGFSMPLFLVEFLREYMGVTPSGTPVKVREWVDNPTTDELRDVRAVRIGFVLVSDKDRNSKAGSGMTMSSQYCPFTGKTAQCYTLTDPNKNAFVFSRTIYLRNFDYLRKSAS